MPRLFGFTNQKTPLRRLLLLGAASLAVFSLVAVGCGDDDDDDDNGDTPTTSSETPTAAASETTEGSPGASATAPGGDLADNAEDYANAVFDAWRASDAAALEELTGDEAMAALVDRPWEDSDEWSSTGCDAGAGSVFCSWESSAGETLSLRIDNEMAGMGEPDAAIEATFT